MGSTPSKPEIPVPGPPHPPYIVMAVTARGVVREVVLLPRLSPLYKSTLHHAMRLNVGPELVSNSRPGDFIAFTTDDQNVFHGVTTLQTLDSGCILRAVGLQNLMALFREHGVTAYRVADQATSRDFEIITEIVNKAKPD